MSELHIDFECNINPLFRDALGTKGFTVFVPDGFLGLSQPLELYSHFCPLLLIFKRPRPEKPMRLEIHSKGTQNVAGNLYGIEANLLNVEVSSRDTLKKLGYHFCIQGDHGAVQRIVGMGEVRVETIETASRREEIACFFPPNAELPDVIHINKKTLDIIGFHFENGKWVYIFAEGEGHFRVLFDHPETPEEMIVSDEFIAAGLNLSILDDIR
jgi:hypothetical protein